MGTRVDPATGSVYPGRMWQWEVLPAGTVFTAHLRLRVTAPDEEAHLLTLLALAARGLGDDGPGIRIGARSGRGHGAVRAVRWAARRHDLTDEPGWFAYHASDWSTRWQEGQSALATPDEQPTGRPPHPVGSTRNRSTEAQLFENTLPKYRSGAELAGLLDALLREHGRVAAAAHLAARAVGVDRRHRAELRMRLHVAERPEPLPTGRPPSRGNCDRGC